VIGDILQPTHLIFVLVIALLVLGPKRLPEVGRALGNGLRDFKSAINGEDDHRDVITDAPGFENYRAESLSDEVHDPTVAPADEDPAATADHDPAATADHDPAAPADHDPAAATAPSVTSPAEPAPPAHPEDASVAATQPSNSVASEPASEPTERLG
jgi:sec-independent protein translocase protein TatA